MVAGFADHVPGADDAAAALLEATRRAALAAPAALRPSAPVAVAAAAAGVLLMSAWASTRHWYVPIVGAVVVGVIQGVRGWRRPPDD